MKMTNETCWNWNGHTAKWEDVGLFKKNLNIALSTMPFNAVDKWTNMG